MATIAGPELHELTLEIRRAAKAPDAKRVHDLRVAIRRFNQSIATVDDNTGDSKYVRSRLRKIMRRAGDARDLDIAIKLVRKLKPSKNLSAALWRERAKAAAKLAKELRGWIGGRAASCAAELSAFKATRASEKKLLMRAAERVFSRGKKAEKAKATAHGLHRVRIAAKKLRYTLELVAPEYPRLDKIKQLQSMLGDINDYETVSNLLKRFSGTGKKLRRRLVEKQDKDIRDFRRFWKDEFSSPAALRSWKQDIAALSR